jgi:phytoene synthase
VAPHDYCRDKAAPDGSSLHYSLLFLDKPRQQAITAVHAFRQEIADVARDCMDIEPALAKLAWWRMEIGALYEQHPSHPVTEALAVALNHFPIAQEKLLEVIDGYEMDIHQGRYDNFNILQHHCYRVSGTISQICCEILGFKNRQTLKFAYDLGLAGQLTDIIRNVGLDARHGRIYLPLDELQQFGVNENDIFEARHDHKPSDNFVALLAFQAQRIRMLHAQAVSQLAAEDRKSQRAILTLAEIQRATLTEIENDNYQVLDHNLSLTPLRKLWIATRTWVRA